MKLRTILCWGAVFLAVRISLAAKALPLCAGELAQRRLQLQARFSKWCEVIDCTAPVPSPLSYLLFESWATKLEGRVESFLKGLGGIRPWLDPEEGLIHAKRVRRTEIFTAIAEGTHALTAQNIVYFTPGVPYTFAVLPKGAEFDGRMLLADTFLVRKAGLHYEITAGQPVITAGEVFFNRVHLPDASLFGIVDRITLRSGLYFTHERRAVPTLRALQNVGLDPRHLALASFENGLEMEMFRPEQ